MKKLNALAHFVFAALAGLLEPPRPLIKIGNRGRGARHWYTRPRDWSDVRTPDDQVRRLRAAQAKRERKCATRLRWKAHGGESTLAERTAAGVSGA